MASASIGVEARPALAPSEVSEIWIGHLMSFLIPVSTLAFVWTGPHSWYTAPLWIAPFAVFHWMDTRPRYERRQPVETLPGWPFDWIVYALAAIHFATLLGLVEMFRTQSVFSIDMAMVFVILGGVGRVFGPVAGAALFILLEPTLGGLSAYWHVSLGAILLGVVLFARGGLYGLIAGREVAHD